MVSRITYQGITLCAPAVSSDTGEICSTQHALLQPMRSWLREREIPPQAPYLADGLLREAAYRKHVRFYPELVRLASSSQ